MSKSFSDVFWFLVLLFCSIGFNNAHALKTDSGDNKTVYFTVDGKQIDAIEAFKEAIAGKEVLGCTKMEAVANQRTGKVNLKKKQ